MNKKTAIKNYLGEFSLSEFKRKYYYDSGFYDSVAAIEEWSYYIDSLCKNNEITEKQYNNWSNPF
jgi:hypothetical protein